MDDFVPCEVCGSRAVDIHHIDARGAGGDQTGEKDTIENLMAVCRSCHIKYGDKEQHAPLLNKKHQEYLDFYENG